MKTNSELFYYSKNHPESLLDSFYSKSVVVIPNSSEENNTLTKNNDKLIDFITTFSILHEELKKDTRDETVRQVVDGVINILDETPYINYSAFVQFFMVYNLTFSIYKSLSIKQKRKMIYEMLKKYCRERHVIYSSHGYTNVVLQVMSDNYSHKRNSKTGIDKVLEILKPYSLTHLKTSDLVETADEYYFLPDKGDKNIFDDMLNRLTIKMESRDIEQEKYPDIVFKHNGHYYICELKTMKESGGGQNKQVVEIAYFIKFSEEKENIHYITFLDSNYSNTIFHNESPKVTKQRNDIILALQNNKNNYFLNTEGMIEFLREIFI